jgi:hypothetical protein
LADIDIVEMIMTDVKYMAILGTLNQLSGINSMKNCENMIIERSVMIS